MKYTLQRITNILNGNDTNPQAFLNLQKYWYGPSVKERIMILHDCNTVQEFALTALTSRDPEKYYNKNTFANVFFSTSLIECDPALVLAFANNKNIHALTPTIVQDCMGKTANDIFLHALFWENTRHTELKLLKEHVFGTALPIWRNYAQHMSVDNMTIHEIVDNAPKNVWADSIFQKEFTNRVVKTALMHSTYSNHLARQALEHAENIPLLTLQHLSTIQHVFDNIEDFLKATYSLLKNDKEREQYRSIYKCTWNMFMQKYGSVPRRAYSAEQKPEPLFEGKTDPVLDMLLETSLQTAASVLQNEHDKISNTHQPSELEIEMD